MSWASRLAVPLAVLMLPISAAVALIFFSDAPPPLPPASVQIGESAQPTAAPPAPTSAPPAPTPEETTVAPPGPVEDDDDDDDD